LRRPERTQAVFHLPAELVEIIDTERPIFEHRRQGVWLARMYRLRWRQIAQLIVSWRNPNEHQH
jgi:hypothetical protein